jgi:hypothetical protein
VSSGYVAVLSSKKSRMDAMKAYASLDQKYRDMLSSSTFDVQEADLGDKGICNRAVVGPPRSYEGAKKICEDLKTAGLTTAGRRDTDDHCWPAGCGVRLKRAAAGFCSRGMKVSRMLSAFIAGLAGTELTAREAALLREAAPVRRHPVCPQRPRP